MVTARMNTFIHAPIEKVWAFLIFLAAFQVFGTFIVSPPPNYRAEAVSALLSYIVLAAIAAWVDRGQTARRA